MSVFKKIFGAIASVFKSKQFKAFEKIAVVAAPIVASLSAAAPNRTAQEVMAAAAKYKVDVIFDENKDFHQRGAALLEIASSVVEKEFPGVPINLIMQVVQQVYDAYKVSK